MKRRNFLKRTIGVGTLTAASTLSAPAISKGKIQWKMVTCWPKNFPALGTGVKRYFDAIQPEPFLFGESPEEKGLVEMWSISNGPAVKTEEKSKINIT